MLMPRKNELFFSFYRGSQWIEFSTLLVSSDAFEMQAHLFRKQGLIIPPAEIAVKDKIQDYILYRFSFTTWETIFIALYTYAINFPPTIINNYNELDISKDVFSIWQQLTENEKQACQTYHQYFLNQEKERNQNYREVAVQLNLVEKLFAHEYTMNSFLGKDSPQAFDLLLLENENLAEKNHQFYNEIIQLTRALTRETNKIATTLNIHRLANKPCFNIKKEFPTTYDNSFLIFSVVCLAQVIELHVKAQLVINHFLENNLLLAQNPNLPALSGLDFLCHHFNNQPSPLIWVIHAEELTDDVKLKIIERLAPLVSYQTNEPNIDIASGSIEQPHINERTPLAHAIDYGTLSMMELLLLNEASADDSSFYHSFPEKKYADHCFITCLHLAVIKNDLEKAQLLLNYGANVNALTGKRKTPLHFSQSEKMAKLLIEFGADLTIADINGETVLHLVAECKNYVSKVTAEMIKENFKLFSFLLPYSKALLNQQNKYGQTPLHKVFVYFGQTFEDVYEWAALLCDAGANVNLGAQYNPEQFQTGHYSAPLMCLFRNSLGCNTAKEVQQKRAIVELLLKHGADMTMRNEDGRTVLHDVILYKTQEECEFLLELSVKYAPQLINAHTPNCSAPLHLLFPAIINSRCTSKIKYDYIFQLLIKYNVDPLVKSFFLAGGMRIQGTILECLNEMMNYPEKSVKHEANILLEAIKNHLSYFLNKQYQDIENPLQQIKTQLFSQMCGEKEADELSMALSKLYAAAQELSVKFPRGYNLIWDIEILAIEQAITGMDTTTMAQVFAEIQAFVKGMPEKVDDELVNLRSEMLKKAKALYFEFASRCIALAEHTPSEQRKIILATAFVGFSQSSSELNIGTNAGCHNMLLELMDLKLEFNHYSTNDLSKQFPEQYNKAQTLIVEQQALLMPTSPVPMPSLAIPATFWQLNFNPPPDQAMEDATCSMNCHQIGQGH